MASIVKFEAGARVPATQVEITVSCRKLLDMDIFSKSDPLCVLYAKEFAQSEWREVGRTEVIWNTLNPDFVKKFEMEYLFEEKQLLKFEVYDNDSNTPDLKKHDFLGSMECTLGRIVSSGRLQRPLDGPKANSGSIIYRAIKQEGFYSQSKSDDEKITDPTIEPPITAEELSHCKEEVTMQFAGQKLDKKDTFGKSDPFLVFYRRNKDMSYTVAHKTEVIKNTLNPTWQPFTISARVLCNGDYLRSLKVECYDWNKDGGHHLIGEFETSLQELTRGKGLSNEYECINPKKKKKKGSSYKHSGIISLIICKIHPIFSFVDFIKGGTQVHCSVAIDFTLSNGDPREPTSLHHISPNQPNQYERALRAVMEIIQDYDSDNLFPALGFGACLPPDGEVSHEFALNGKLTDPNCKGVEGVMMAYQEALRKVQLHGPTNFAPIIDHVSRFAAAKQTGADYFILLILTDGAITDLQDTKEAIVKASCLPLSIIIVGIGDDEFDAMDELNGNEVRVSSCGVEAERDIVQFVPFRNFLGHAGENNATIQARLAKEVLAEVPEQFTSFMTKMKIRPRPLVKKKSTETSL